METREAVEGATRRRRECHRCSKRFTTYERVEQVDLEVIKKDGHTERFDREKLARGIRTACSKRPIAPEQVERVVMEVEKQLRKRKKLEVPSGQIGKLVMRRLRALDKIAYVRFASVYQDFDDLADFQQEVQTLQR